ncbi:hypothetical protein EN962_32400 [Mesorhizobium sp. M7A.F.Ca.CA.001.09.2.1]|uniref:Uncharacterized protein n=2 Tax=Mesorhizobium ciceri TaxID=39645 RepID=E8TNN8_MESCW|nr:hypothetical protein Mesci_4928 [Mesorhizobium ciceri biovar biserrulae WSM1271]RUU18307.1 hypothetical protein EOC84_21425 [Mesorhizobium sp. Primo-B]RUU36210.1 hypothetical protein EOC83_22655 [Mesorhizobium sp. Primo-A]RUX16499.1 hypothetical protein EN996_08690 [Mesorhizobium sp. M7A.F.Ca.CA.002.14.1.2]RUX41092.1 hypothetical protein EN987_04110 [Mesorhizobium sp. M7A.F.Ca.CA.002.11.2.1]RUX43746.1 hypothetical protein EN994_28955 [Mesorhizobium sp. M7A.F.Ca.CA.002.09.1.1]RUX56528.1 hyp
MIDETKSSSMSNRETKRSDALSTRVTEIKARMQQAQITEDEMKTFQKVAAIMEGGEGRIEVDDLIAASFLTDTLLNSPKR